MSDWILLAGYGSIGRRHFRNLKHLGRDDVRLLRSGRQPAEGFETPPGTPTYTDLEHALSDGPAVVVVSNPTSMHGEVARSAIEAGAGVLLEKPVSDSIEEARALQTQVEALEGLCSMAYTFRYHPLYRRLEEVVREGRLGRVFHAHARQASYLPDWHPWEDHRESYAAREELGGGVVRTLDHDLDLIQWMLGPPSDVLASAGSLSGIGVPVEDTADMIFRFPDRLQAHVHVCFGRRDYSRGMWVVGETASAVLDWNAGSLVVSDGRREIERFKLPEDYELNQAYLDMLQDALTNFSSSKPREAVPLAAGVNALEMAVSALQSSRTSRAVSLQTVEAAA